MSAAPNPPPPAAAPPPLRVFVGPPGVPTTGVANQLSNARSAAIRADAAGNSAAAASAAAAYRQGVARAASGNVAGALGSAASAQAAASSAIGPVAPALAPVYPPPLGPVATPAAGIPLVANDASLPADLYVARREIDLAQSVSPGRVASAKAHYRAALDAYVSGSTTRYHREARAAFDAAADAFTSAK